MVGELSRTTVGELVEPRGGLYKFQMPSSTDPESTFAAVWDDR